MDFRKILIVFTVFLMASCVSTSSYVNLTKESAPNFFILSGNDPLNLYSIVQEEISRVCL
jgi:hypothetical protein